MTKEETIEEACTIMGLVYDSIGDFSEPSDGFCRRCPAATCGDWNFQNSGKALDYIRTAVVEKLRADGYEIAPGFDPIAGEEEVGLD